MFDGMGVAVGAAGVAVGAAGVVVAVAVPLRVMMIYSSSPKKTPVRVDMRQFPRTLPVKAGAVMAMERLDWAPGLTALSNTRVVPPMAFPLVKANLKPAVQGQVPEFLTSQVLVKVWPGTMGVLSGMVTSLIPVRP